MRNRIASILSILLLSCLAMGCGEGYGKTPSVYTARGKVAMQNGKAVTGAYIKFIPTSLEGVEAEAELADDGTFTLKAIGGKEGAVPGAYKVVLDVSTPSARPAAKTNDAKRVIPKTYLSRETTPLTAEIKPEDNNFTFTLK